MKDNIENTENRARQETPASIWLVKKCATPEGRPHTVTHTYRLHTYIYLGIDHRLLPSLPCKSAACAASSHRSSPLPTITIHQSASHQREGAHGSVNKHQAASRRRDSINRVRSGDRHAATHCRSAGSHLQLRKGAHPCRRLRQPCAHCLCQSRY